MNKLHVVDSHFHIWDTNQLRYPWLDNRGILNRPYLTQDYAAAMQSVVLDGAVYVEVTSTDYVKEVDWVTRQDPSVVKGIVSWCPVEQEELIVPELERLAAIPLVKGVRRMLKKDPDPELCLRPSFLSGVRRLPEYGLVYDMAILPRHIESAYRMMKQCPEVTFIIEHCAEPDIKGNGFVLWSSGMRKVAQLPNAHCKLSGFVTKIDRENGSIHDIDRYVEFILQQFGFDRVMFGSDWPPVTQVTALEEWIAVLLNLLHGESQETIDKVFWKNAITQFNLDLKG